MSTHQLRSESEGTTRQRIFPRETRAASAESLQGGPHPIRQLQRMIGNRHVARLVQTRRLLPNGKMVGLQSPIALQRAACEYESGEKATGIDRGILGTDVQSIPATGSGYDAAPNSVVIADFRPESAVVRTSTAEELRRGRWIDTLERQSLPYALLGFTDCVGEESDNQTLRADRARAVAAILPGTARRASGIGAAPAGHYLLPGNSTPPERALNRAVLLRLPFEELRQAAEIDTYSEHTVRFWQLNKTGAVDDLIRVASAETGALLDRNGVPRPKILPGKAAGKGTLAFFTPKDWSITLDVDKMTSSLPQKSVTHATKMSTLTVDSVAELASTCYHESRHAEQHFFAARQVAADAPGGMTAKDLADNLQIPITIAAAAVSASKTPLPDKYKIQARAWRTTMPGGRQFAYKMWNEKLRPGLEFITGNLEWDKYRKLRPDVLKGLWDRALRKFIDTLRDSSLEGEALLKAMGTGPDPDPVDAGVRKALTKTSGKLFMVLATSQQAKKLPDTAAVTKMRPEDLNVAQLEAESLMINLQLHLVETEIAAEEAYRAYPVEAESYQVEDLVKPSIKEHGSK